MTSAPETDRVGKKLVFIVGAGRSGTNWLRRLLSQSPNVATGPETHLFSSYLRSAAESWRHFDGSKVGLAHLISEEEMLAWMRDFANMCFGRIAQKRPDARIVLEKTPNHGGRGAEILQLFPDCYFIHIIRDPRAVVTSLRAAAKSWGSCWAPGQIKDACRMWQKHVMRAEAIASLTSRYSEVRYERLHADGAEEIARLFAWLGEPVDRAEAERYVAKSSFDKIRAKSRVRIEDGEVDKQFFRRGEVDSWRRELSATEIAIVERLTRKHMAQLGYEPVAARPARIAAAARLGAYLAANKLAKAVRAGADRIKP